MEAAFEHVATEQVQNRESGTLRCTLIIDEDEEGNDDEGVCLASTMVWQ